MKFTIKKHKPLVFDSTFLVTSQEMTMHERVYVIPENAPEEGEVDVDISRLNTSDATCGGGIDEHEHQVYCGCSEWGNTPENKIANFVLKNI